MLTRSMRLVLIASTLTSSQAFALIHGQALVGKRWAEITPDGSDKTGVQATELAAAVSVSRGFRCVSARRRTLPVPAVNHHVAAASVPSASTRYREGFVYFFVFVQRRRRMYHD
jgi:hypothetical protein